MNFEFDEAKSRSNKEKHGIDFVEGQAIWLDACRLELPAKTRGEPRFRMVGKIEGRLWAAVVTYRGERVRIISIRRPWKKEVTEYERDHD